MSKIKTPVAKDTKESNDIPPMNSVAWTDHVLGMLGDDEKIAGNPTTDGLRRIFEEALNCTLIELDTKVIQAPSPENEKRATVACSLTYVLNDPNLDPLIKTKRISGAADVYWGNCDKVYRNHPVAVAETRAEGRALRKALRLRKVVAAEEIAENIEDDPNGDTVLKISSNQINFMDVMAKRTDINVIELIKSLDIGVDNIRAISHDNAVLIIKRLTEYQQSIQDIPPSIIGYQPQWKEDI
jgi:hypothetical protein